MKTLKLLAAAFLAAFMQPFRTANAEGAGGTRTILSRRADAAHSYTHLLVTGGSDAGHVAVCGAANYPVGLTTDMPSAAEDLINVTPLQLSTSTRKVRVASALGADIDLYTAASGFAQAEPGTAGSFFKIGRSVSAAVQNSDGGYVIEFAPQAPIKLVVAATPSTVGNIAAALASPTLVKFL
ncbi:MAG: hypothetical protein ABIT76_08660 [Chthoniobacterales bacterium]